MMDTLHTCYIYIRKGTGGFLPALLYNTSCASKRWYTKHTHCCNKEILLSVPGIIWYVCHMYVCTALSYSLCLYINKNTPNVSFVVRSGWRKLNTGKHQNTKWYFVECLPLFPLQLLLYDSCWREKRLEGWTGTAVYTYIHMIWYYDMYQVYQEYQVPGTGTIITCNISHESSTPYTYSIPGTIWYVYVPRSRVVWRRYQHDIMIMWW